MTIEFREPLAVFLEAVLEGASTVRVVTDNCRGIGQDDAKSYTPPHQWERMSNSSLPALSRWGNNCSQLIDSAEELLDRIDQECPPSPPCAAPQVPRRRSSVESSEDDWRVFWDDLAAELDDDDSSSSEEEEEEEIQITLPLVEDLMAWNAKFAALPDALPTDRDSLRGSLKDNLSPPRAPRRQNSLNYSDHTPLASNISLPSDDQLDNSDIQRVHKRRHGITLPLSSVAREIIQGSDEEEVDESPMFSASARQKKDSLPCCARRRPSPQLEKLASLRSIDVSCKAPVGAKRRSSPQMKLDEKNCCCLAAPVRAKRRPSPEEYEAFNSLVDALKDTVTILEENTLQVSNARSTNK